MQKKEKIIKHNKYLQAIIICHGLSEYHIAGYLGSNLRLNIGIYAEQKGKSSIQINSLNKHLSNKIFSSKKNLLKKYNIDLNNKILHNKFKIFIIMDTDDKELTIQDITEFKNKNMFKWHWAYDYIVPIFNTHNLEDVLTKAKIIDDKHKKKDYIKLFPINHNATTDDIKEIEILKGKLKHINNTNLDVLLDYLLNFVK